MALVLLIKFTTKLCHLDCQLHQKKIWKLWHKSMPIRFNEVYEPLEMCLSPSFQLLWQLVSLWVFVGCSTHLDCRFPQTLTPILRYWPIQHLLFCLDWLYGQHFAFLEQVRLLALFWVWCLFQDLCLTHGRSLLAVKFMLCNFLDVFLLLDYRDQYCLLLSLVLLVPISRNLFEKWYPMYLILWSLLLLRC